VAFQQKDINLDEGGVQVDRSTGAIQQISATGGVFVESIPAGAQIFISFDQSPAKVLLRALRSIDQPFESCKIYHPPAYKGVLTLQFYSKGEGIFDVPLLAGGAAGTTRRTHSFLDWTGDTGPGFGGPTYTCDVGFMGGTRDAWHGLSGSPVRFAGYLCTKLGATSFNQGIGSGFFIPIVGRPPMPPTTPVKAEGQQFYSYKFSVGLEQNGAAPWTGEDVGIFFTPHDGGAFASIGKFYGDGTNGSVKGAGLFVKPDFTWHYGVRIIGSLVSPLTIDIDLTAAGIMPGGSAAALRALTDVEFRWIDVGAGEQPRFQLIIANNTLVDTTVADAGVIPAIAGLGTQLPSMAGDFPPNVNEYGFLGVMRSTSASPPPELCFSNIEFTAGANLSTTY
jgi:hypothetical protein